MATRRRSTNKPAQKSVTPTNKYPFATVSSGDIPDRVTGFIYGPSGSGKTFMVRSAVEDPDMFPILVCSCDSGELTLRDLIDDDKLVVTQTGLEELSNVFNYLHSRQNRFKTVVIDNLTELHRRALMARGDQRVAEGKAKTVGEFTMQDYGIARTQILAVVSNFALQLTGMNVFFTALSTTVTDELSGAVSYEPDIAGRLSGEVPGYCDVVGYLTVDTPSAAEVRKAEREGRTLPIERVLITNATRQVPIARNRGGKLGDKVQNPTLPLLRSMLLASRGA